MRRSLGYCSLGASGLPDRTTILDPADARADELAAAYHQRWEEETANDQLKTHLRGDRTSPRAVTRARHNNYRVKKPGEPASTRHDGPATIRLHTLNPRAA